MALPSKILAGPYINPATWLSSPHSLPTLRKDTLQLGPNLAVSKLPSASSSRRPLVKSPRAVLAKGPSHAQRGQGHRSILEHNRPIRSEVRYSHPPRGGEQLYIKVSEKEFTEWDMNIGWADVPVLIHDARPLAGRTSLDKEGFEVHVSDSKVQSWDDESEVTSVYYAEAVDLVKQATGAKHAAVFDHTFRRAAGAESGPQRPKARDPVIGVHVDYSSASAQQRLVDFYGEAVAQRVGRFAIVNVWRPLVETVYDLPLGFIDATSLREGDLSAYNLIYPDRVGQNQTVHPNTTSHKWYYLPYQKSNEVYLFKQYDSDASKTQWTPHSAFKDPTVPEKEPFAPRESIELRVFVFYEGDEQDLQGIQ